ncbi:histidine kinase [Dethiosulfatarculus sandiegensis]|uniref:histidine kinase n=2 Tax=Dethiosulfatarculus sandiegensis TaxID=1429043 RepID=A0A0D2JTV1_9BACT|nr:histidine kinase [Dethiosulfatarculus sandiegensis]
MKQIIEAMVTKNNIFWILSGLVTLLLGTTLFLGSHLIYDSFTEKSQQIFLLNSQKQSQSMADHLTRAQENAREMIWDLAHDPEFLFLARKQRWTQLGNNLLRLYSAVQGLFFYYCPGQGQILLPKATIHYKFLENLFPLLSSNDKAGDDIFYFKVQGNHLIIQTHSVHYGDIRLGTLLAVCDLARAVSASKTPHLNTIEGGFYLSDTSGFKHAVKQDFLFTPQETRRRLCLGDQTELEKTTLETGFTPVPGYPDLTWYSPTKALEQKNQAMKNKMFLLALVFLGLMLICCFMVFRSFSNKVTDLTTQIKSLHYKGGKGHLPYPRGVMNGLDNLVRHFNSLLRSLQAEQREMEQTASKKLDAAQKRYEILVETSPSGLLFIDSQKKPNYANPAFCKISGYTTEDLSRLEAEELFIENNFPKGRLLQALADSPQGRAELKLLCKNGSYVWVEVRVVRVSREKGPAYIVSLVDISQRKTAQREVEKERERLSLILDGNPIPTFVIGPDKKVLFWNKACHNLTKVPKERVLSQKLDSSVLYVNPKKPLLANLVLDMDLKELENWYGQQGIKASPTIPEAFEVTTTLILKKKERIVYNLAARLRDKDGNILGAIETLQDVSEREELARQLEHSQKMQAIGTLAGGMAHEFNNILAAVKGYAQLLLNKTKSDSQTAQYAREIDKACKRASGLTTNMLTFSRHHKSEKKPVMISRVLSSVEGLLSQTLGPNITLDFRLEKNLPQVLAQPNQLEQVFINLLVNARDAMPKGGSIEVFAQKETMDEEFLCRRLGLEPGDYVAVRVKDSGTGFTPEVKQKIFEPFFTTKEPGKGTGLGLSIAYSIITNFAGCLSCESKPEEGSTFTIFLPAHSQATPGDADKEEVVHKNKTGKGQSILVVDDEKQIRQILKEILTTQGYTITTAEHGKEALYVYRNFLKKGKPFDLVILDLAMPVMDGPTCLKALHQIHPKVKVLITTGHSVNSLKDSSQLSGTTGLLNKPFDLSQLLQAVEYGLNYKQIL